MRHLKTYEARKKLIYTKDYIYWYIEQERKGNMSSPNVGLFKLIKKYLRWKLDVDRVYNPITLTKYTDDSIGIDSGQQTYVPSPILSIRIYPKDMDEFIDFLNNPEMVMNTNKYNL